MIKLAFSAAVLLSCMSQLDAVHTCNANITSGFLAETQAALSYIDEFTGMDTWVVSASPDDEFGLTESYYLNFNKSCDNLALIYVTQLFTDGTVSNSTHVMLKEVDSEYYFEPGFDLYLNFFVCDDDLVAAYKCKKSSEGLTLFLIIGPYGTTADEMDVASCKAKISAIYPETEFKDMSYPTYT